MVHIEGRKKFHVDITTTDEMRRDHLHRLRLIQRQEPGMLSLCAQILIRVSVSVEKAPNAPYVGPFSDMVKLRYVLGFFSRYVHPNWKRSTQRKHSSLLPLDWHPTSLCLDVVKFLLFNGVVKFYIENPPSWLSKFLWNNFIFPFLYMKGNQIRLSLNFW